MQKKHQPQYSRLTLGGYQTFADVNNLPLGRLTFLFGPNSAGKSAVEDGFRLFSELIDSEKFTAITGLNGFDYLRRHFRRLSDDPLTFAPFLTIGLEAKPSKQLQYLLSTEFDEPKLVKYLNKHEGHTIEYKAEFPLREESKDHIDVSHVTGHEIEFKFDKLSILKIHMQNRMGLNLNHPLLKTLEIMQTVKSVPSNINNTASLDNEWLWITGGFQVLENGRVEDEFPKSNDSKLATENALLAFPDFKVTIEKLLKTLPRLFDVSFSLVSASRTIPNATDLLFFSDAPKGEYDWTPQMERFPLPKMGDETYRPLAESLIAPDTTNISPIYFTCDDLRDDSNLGELVNKALSEHLFLERGYRVAADYRLLLSREQYDALEIDGIETSSRRGDFPAITRLYLIDSQGREFSFSDVGSGLGYVLPVLVALFGNQSVSIIQQPELHLHPALQAAMGDVVIDACNQGKQVIIETHSEHMLLRVLRRIKQSSSGTLLEEGLRINSDDISILYFDPSPDGTTKVSRIRVSSDGEFLDRWPRGFFAERDQELFDE